MFAPAAARCSPAWRRSGLLAVWLVGALATLPLLAACSDGSPTIVEDRLDGPATTAATPATGTAPGGGTGDGDELHGFVPEPLDWEGCGGEIECATLAVPLDWDQPGGEQIELAVTRIPAADPDRRLGAIATNPGGPGASGNEYIRFGSPFDETLTDRFDTISWDPRGVGDSAPLGCDGEEVDEFLTLDSDPDTAAEQAALDGAAEAVALRCAEEAGDLLPFVGTDAVARDLEAIRRSYGEPMAYVGFSYGTAIGLHHLELLPGAMRVVLDGVIDPAHSQTDLLRGQTTAFEEVVAAVFAGCPPGSEGCPDGGAEGAYDEVLAAVETRPLAAGGEAVGPSELATATILATYDEGYWPLLYEALTDAQQGDGRGLLELAQAYRTSGAFDAYQAVSCLDSANPKGAAAWAAFASELEAISPRFGASVANEMLPCAFWPTAPRPVNHEIEAAGSGPVLVVGTTGDAATPVEQARRVAETLAEGHLVVYDGEGHTAYGTSDCVRDLVAAFLIDGDVPSDGARC